MRAGLNRLEAEDGCVDGWTCGSGGKLEKMGLVVEAAMELRFEPFSREEKKKWVRVRLGIPRGQMEYMRVGC